MADLYPIFSQHSVNFLVLSPPFEPEHFGEDENKQIRFHDDFIFYNTKMLLPCEVTMDSRL